jgi:signal peptidase II
MQHPEKRRQTKEAPIAWPTRARLFWPLAAALLLADCTTKEWAESHLGPAHVPHPIVGDVVRFTLAFNPDSAMGLLRGPSARLGLAVAGLFVITFLAQVYRRTAPAARLRATALALVVGGASGNLVSRLSSSRGVTDFIDIGWGSLRFYTFNVADLGITVGASLLFLALRREERRTAGAA